ncbi:hypothetical protein Tco_1008499, partial [Tanacetum coccineum]
NGFNDDDPSVAACCCSDYDGGENRVDELDEVGGRTRGDQGRRSKKMVGIINMAMPASSETSRGASTLLVHLLAKAVSSVELS